MATATVMLSPLPRKAVHSPMSLPTSPIPYSPSEAGTVDLNTARPFWFDVDGDDFEAFHDLDEACVDIDGDLATATQDLHEVLWRKMLPEWMPAFDDRSFSVASTCAASTCATSPGPPTSPAPPSCFSPSMESSSPDRSMFAPSCISTAMEYLESSSPDRSSSLEDFTKSATSNQQPQCPPGALDKSSWLQARKVFVGGIPQTVDQNGLYHMFSKIGKVKKAWLQLFHAEASTRESSSAKKVVQKHRGFGFVIFYEKQSIDQLFGKEVKRFVTFGDTRLEVKRSFGKNSAVDEKPSTMGSKTSPASAIPWQMGSPSPPQPWQNCAGQMPLADPPSNGTSKRFSNPVSPTSPQVWQSASPAPPQSVQIGTPNAVWIGVQTSDGFPQLPPFPFGLPAVVPMPAYTPQPPPSQPPASAQSLSQVMTNAALAGFMGPKPQSPDELQQTLLEALPEVYEE